MAIKVKLSYSISKAKKRKEFEGKWGKMVSDWLFEDTKEKSKLTEKSLQKSETL
ncbi:hypothetical protein [Planomicrobium okeanokoites]|uniref:hypothetical protein n=1 Tax=Planomicrobium okeanokoites TaxID=244 RepID=UPI0015C4BFD6|nr:hypothetical protein [Planomicrobium okeanokoites]